MAKRTFKSKGGSSGGGGVSVSVVAGNTYNGATYPLPVSFGNGQSYNFYGNFSGVPIFVRNFGDIAARTKYCHSCAVIDGNIVLVGGGSIWIDQVIGAPAGQIKASLQTDTAGAPSGSILTSVNFTPGGTPGRTSFTFPVPYELKAPSGGGDVSYFLVFERTVAVDPANYWVIGADNIYGTNASPFSFNGATWDSSDLVPSSGLTMTYDVDKAYISAQSITGTFTYAAHRMRSLQTSSGSGNAQVDSIPDVLQSSQGWVTQDAAIGDTISVLLAGDVPGFTALVPVDQYNCDRGDGHISNGTSSVVIVGRAIKTTDMLIDRS